jgi:hypothetical protein
MDNFFKKKYLVKQEKYKKIVRLYLLYNADISYKEMAKKINTSEYTIGCAINDYFSNPEFYKIEINSDLYANNIRKTKNTVGDLFIPDKVEVGINTMKFWADISKYKRQLYGNVKGNKIDVYNIEKIVNYTLNKRKNKKNKNEL